MSELKDEERTIEVRSQPDSPRTQTEVLSIPFGEVHRIIDIVCLDRAFPDFEIALQVNGVRQAGFCASTVHEDNGSKPMSNAFANFPIHHGHLAYFVATPLHSLTKPMSIRFRLTIRRSVDEMIINSQSV
jgi:hypothetical protein